MAEYIERQAAIEAFENGEADVIEDYGDGCDFGFGIKNIKDVLSAIPAADVAPVRHGRWIYEAHEEKVNCRWNVTAECSECCDEKNEIWAGFFLGVPSCIAKDVAIENAKGVKLSKFCPNCGARMDLGGADNG